jgi:cytochrome c biogenesis protein CcmG, thiol:disulfide interchange protein DsbE
LKRNLKTGLVLAFILGLLVLFIRPEYRQGAASLRGTPALDFAFTLDGKPAHLSDLRGKVVVLNFWATWCPPCVDEADSLVQLQNKIAPLGGTVLGISQDEDESAYEQFLAAHHVNYPNFREPSAKIPRSYGTTMIPETYIIDRHGNLDRKIVGPQDWTNPEMMQYLNSVLAEK